MDALRPPRCVPVAQSSLESRAARGHRPARGETDLLVLIFMCRPKQFHPALGYGTSGERCGRALAHGIRESTENPRRKNREGLVSVIRPASRRSRTVSRCHLHIKESPLKSLLAQSDSALLRRCAFLTAPCPQRSTDSHPTRRLTWTDSLTKGVSPGRLSLTF